MAAKFEVRARQEGESSVIEVTGDVDMDSSPELRDRIQEALKSSGTVRVHLGGVSYLDSSGIAVLIQGLKWAQQKNATYVLVEPSSQVQQVIELAQLGQLFTIEPAGEG